MCQQILVNFFNTKFNENPFRSSHVLNVGIGTGRNGEVVAAFLQPLYAKVPKNKQTEGQNRANVFWTVLGSSHCNIVLCVTAHMFTRKVILYAECLIFYA
jgi:hypothetical protein